MVKAAKSQGNTIKAHCWAWPNPKASDRMKIKLPVQEKYQLLKIRSTEIIF